MLAETLHEAVQRLFGALGQRQQVIKGSRALVPALKCINELLTQVLQSSKGGEAISHWPAPYVPVGTSLPSRWDAPPL
jgi:hypothetical protein